MNNHEVYKVFCEKEKELPLFLSYAWLNTVAPESWDVVIEEKGGEIIAAFPYVLQHRLGFKLMELPALTSYGGIWIKYPEGQKYTTRLSYEKEIFTALLDKLPRFDFFAQKFYPGFTNWLPFFWKGYKETTAYTYIIEDLSNTKAIFLDFKENIRREIRKAGKTITITSSSDAIDILYDLYNYKGAATKMKLSITKDYMNTIFQFCVHNNCGELLVAKDEKGKTHAAALFVRDKKTTYYLFGVADPIFKNSGAMSLLIWEAIQRASTKSKQFNFDGSMVEGIERFFRGFGAQQVPYFILKKYNSNILKIRAFLSELI